MIVNFIKLFEMNKEYMYMYMGVLVAHFHSSVALVLEGCCRTFQDKGNASFNTCTCIYN